jgi:hypothetical protein
MTGEVLLRLIVRMTGEVLHHLCRMTGVDLHRFIVMMTGEGLHRLYGIMTDRGLHHSLKNPGIDTGKIMTCLFELNEVTCKLIIIVTGLFDCEKMR